MTEDTLSVCDGVGDGSTISESQQLARISKFGKWFVSAQLTERRQEDILNRNPQRMAA